MSMLSFYQGFLDEAVKQLADAIARGADASHIKILEGHIIKSRKAIDRERCIASGKLPKGKRDTFAKVPGHAEWFLVDKVVGKPEIGDPYFLGKGEGFDIFRVLVYAYDDSDALESAERQYPRRIKEDSEIRILCKPDHVSKGMTLGGGDARLITGENIRYT